MNAKELADVIDWIESVSDDVGACGHKRSAVILNESAERLKALIPRYRTPQPSDHGKWCFLEELPSDAPPKLVRSCGRSVREIVVADDVRLDYVPIYQYWTTAGWRELTGNVWPCERPEGGGT